MARKNSIKEFIIGLVSIMVLLGIVGFFAIFTRGFEQDVATFYCRYNEQMLIGTADVIFPREKSTVEVKYLLEFAETNTDYTVKVTPNVEKDFTYKVGETSYKFSEIDDLTSCFKIGQQEGYFTIDFSYLYTMQDVLDSKFYSDVTLSEDFDLNDYYFIMTVESNKKDTVIIRFGSACEHVPMETIGKAATCTESGLTNGSVCSVCGEILERQEVIPASHTAVKVAGKAATCTETGLTDGSVCSVCGEILEKQEVIPVSHTAVKVAGKAATCTETGLTDGSVCSVCGEVLDEQEEIAVLGHDFGAESCHRCGLNYSMLTLSLDDGVDYSLTLGDKIGFNVIYELNNSEAQGNGYVKFVRAENFATVPVSEAEKTSDGKYIFSYYVGVLAVDDDITAQYFDNAGNGGTVYTCSVKHYCDEILNLDSATAEKPLVTALLNYVGFAQIYNGETENIVNADLFTDSENPVYSVADETLTAFQSNEVQSGRDTTTGISLTNMLISLIDNFKITYYYEFSDGYDWTDYRISVDGGLAYEIDENTLVLRIPALHLDKFYTLTIENISDGTTMIWTFSLLSLSSRYLSIGDENLTNCVKGMYLYNVAVHEYFETKAV